MKVYGIAEIFYSIQGEGARAGIPTVFIRLAGCNYQCSWCDTDFSVKDKMTANEITDQVYELAVDAFPHICITGGEPTNYDLKPLLDELHCIFDYPKIEIETNGSRKEVLEELMAYAWVTVSPKEMDGAPCQEWAGFANAIKLVYQGQDLSRFVCKAGHYYLQPLMLEDDPEATKENFRKTVEAVKGNPLWRLSLQTQKWVGIR